MFALAESGSSKILVRLELVVGSSTKLANPDVGITVQSLLNAALDEDRLDTGYVRTVLSFTWLGF